MKPIINQIQQSNATIIVVSKYHTVSEMQKAMTYGFTNFGENKLQDLKLKHNQINNVTWHFIGRIQSNKIKEIVKYSDVIHSVASLPKLLKINEAASNLHKVQKVYLQVNIINDISKDGFTITEVLTNISTMNQLENIRIIGIMVIGPNTDDKALIKETFFLAQQFKVQLQQSFPTINRLSMGMSNDYQLALEYGATDLRLGTIIFENLD